MDSELNQQVVLLMGGAVVKVRRTAHGATVLVTDEDTGEQVIADTAQFQHLREAVERLNDEKIDANARAYAAERRVRELEAKIEAMEQAFDYGQPNPFKAKG